MKSTRGVEYLDSSIQRSAGKLVVVFGVDDNLHDVVGVTLKHLGTGPFLLPVPQFDQHVICRTQGKLTITGSKLTITGSRLTITESKLTITESTQ